MHQCILGVDVGTSSIKIVALNSAGKVVAMQRTEYGAGQPAFEHDGQLVWASFVKGLAEIVDGHGLKPACICLSTHMHSWARLQADTKEPQTRFWLWNHPGGEASVQAMPKHLAKQIYLATGMPQHGMSPLHKARVFPKETNGHETCYGGVKEWLFHRLTGHFELDASTAAATGLWGAQAGQWHPQAMHWARLTPEQLATVVPNLHCRPLGQSLAGLPAGLPVCIGSSDGCAAMHHAHWMAPGLPSLTIGSSMAARRWLAQPMLSWPSQPFCYPLLDGWVLGAPGNNGGKALQWTIRELLHMEMQAGMAWLASTANSPEKFADDEWFLPFVNGGERAPLWHSDAQPCWSPKAAQLSLQRKAALAAEAVFLHAGVLVGLLQLPPAQAVVVSGGVCQLAAFRQLLANVLGRPCMLPESQADASAMGAALLGVQALGWPLPQAQETLRETLPQPQWRAYFEQRLAIYQGLLAAETLTP